MSPSVFGMALLKTYEELDIYCHSDEEMMSFLLKQLAFSTMFESEDDDLLPQTAIRGFNSLSHDDHEFIVKLRNSTLLSSISLKEEKFVYTTLRKILDL